MSTVTTRQPEALPIDDQFLEGLMPKLTGSFVRPEVVRRMRKLLAVSSDALWPADWVAARIVNRVLAERPQG